MGSAESKEKRKLEKRYQKVYGKDFHTKDAEQLQKQLQKGDSGTANPQQNGHVTSGEGSRSLTRSNDDEDTTMPVAKGRDGEHKAGPRGLVTKALIHTSSPNSSDDPKGQAMPSAEQKSLDVPPGGVSGSNEGRNPSTASERSNISTDKNGDGDGNIKDRNSEIEKNGETGQISESKSSQVKKGENTKSLLAKGAGQIALGVTQSHGEVLAADEDDNKSSSSPSTQVRTKDERDELKKTIDKDVSPEKVRTQASKTSSENSQLEQKDAGKNEKLPSSSLKAETGKQPSLKVIVSQNNIKEKPTEMSVENSSPGAQHEKPAGLRLLAVAAHNKERNEPELSRSRETCLPTETKQSCDQPGASSSTKASLMALMWKRPNNRVQDTNAGEKPHLGVPRRDLARDVPPLKGTGKENCPVHSPTIGSSIEAHPETLSGKHSKENSFVNHGESESKPKPHELSTKARLLAMMKKPPAVVRASPKIENVKKDGTKNDMTAHQGIQSSDNTSVGNKNNHTVQQDHPAPNMKMQLLALMHGKSSPRPKVEESEPKKTFAHEGEEGSPKLSLAELVGKMRVVDSSPQADKDVAELSHPVAKAHVNAEAPVAPPIETNKAAENSRASSVPPEDMSEQKVFPIKEPREQVAPPRKDTSEQVTPSREVPREQVAPSREVPREQVAPSREVPREQVAPSREDFREQVAPPIDSRGHVGSPKREPRKELPPSYEETRKQVAPPTYGRRQYEEEPRNKPRKNEAQYSDRRKEQTSHPDDVYWHQGKPYSDTQRRQVVPPMKPPRHRAQSFDSVAPPRDDYRVQGDIYNQTQVPTTSKSSHSPIIHIKNPEIPGTDSRPRSRESSPIYSELQYSPTYPHHGHENMQPPSRGKAPSRLQPISSRRHPTTNIGEISPPSLPRMRNNHRSRNSRPSMTDMHGMIKRPSGNSQSPTRRSHSPASKYEVRTVAHINPLAQPELQEYNRKHSPVGTKSNVAHVAPRRGKTVHFSPNPDASPSSSYRPKQTPVTRGGGISRANKENRTNSLPRYSKHQAPSFRSSKRPLAVEKRIMKRSKDQTRRKNKKRSFDKEMSGTHDPHYSYGNVAHDALLAQTYGARIQITGHNLKKGPSYSDPIEDLNQYYDDHGYGYLSSDNYGYRVYNDEDDDDDDDVFIMDDDEEDEEDTLTLVR